MYNTFHDKKCEQGSLPEITPKIVSIISTCIYIPLISKDDSSELITRIWINDFSRLHLTMISSSTAMPSDPTHLSAFPGFSFA